MQVVDTLIYATWVIPVVPQNQALNDHAIAINNGRIIDILPQELAIKKYTSQQTLHLSGQALLPGFVNAHTHSPMALLRGIANDLKFMDWINNYIWPQEKKWLSEKFVYDATQLALAEMIRGGTTCFNEHYFFPETICKATAEIGMRAGIGFTILDFPTSWAVNADEAINKGLMVYEKYATHPLIKIIFAPHAPYTLCDESLKKIVLLTEKLNAINHIHVHESKDEIAVSLKTYGKRPLQRLYELGVLNSNAILVHMVQINDDDLALVEKTGAHVVHCPKSNLKLANGFCPVTQFQARGVNIALGTDSAASNNNLDMVEEMRTAALIAKGITDDSCALKAPEVLAMATINGANALGLGAEIGSLEIGKAADLISINLETLSASPVYDPIAQIVYASHASDITNVWVAGRQLLASGLLTTLDEASILQKTKDWGRKIISKSSLF